MRKVKVYVIPLLLIILFLGAYFLLHRPSEADLASKVGSSYGDSHPKIINITQEQEEVTKKTMYLITISGFFHKGNLQSHHISFSIMADGSKIWAIRAFDNNNQDIWGDNSLPQ